LARSRDRVGAPEMGPGLRIPAVEEQASPVLGAGETGDDYAVGDQRRAGHRISVLEVDDVRLPQLLAGLDIESYDIRIESGAVDFAVIKGGAAIDDAAADDAQHFGWILDLGIPDFLAGLGVDCDRGTIGRHIKDTVVDQRLC